MKKEDNDRNGHQKEFVPTADFYSQVIDSLQDYAILTIDKDLIINSWSAGATNLFGFDKDEAVGQALEIIYTEEDRSNGIPTIEIDKASREGKAVDNRYHRVKGGEIFFAYGLAFPLISKEGELMGYVKILRDLTERKKADEALKKYVEELEELNLHKESILTILSHDLRSPLTGIIQLAELLKEEYANMEDEAVKMMHNALYEMSTDELNMLDYLLDWARIKVVSEVFTPKKVKLAPFVEKVFNTLNNVASQKEVSLRHEVDPGIFVFADGKMLHSILQNLVSNAINFSPKGEEVIVTASQMENKVLVQVKDRGPGLSESKQKNLFTLQVKALLKARKEERGGGIGLLLVKDFLEKHGGEIWVDSVEGEGACFNFTLPADEFLISGNMPLETNF